MMIPQVHRVLENKQGFTLIEMLIAMVIILLVFLGLVQATLLSIDGNLRNVVRDEAVRVATQRMSGVLVDNSGGANEPFRGLKNIDFNDADLTPTFPNWTCLTPDFFGSVAQRNFRNSTVNYNVCWMIEDLTTDAKRVDVAVGWNHRNENPTQAPTNMEFQHTIASIVRRPVP